MQQLSLLRLFAFIIFLVVYSAFFDPSFQLFLTATENLKNLNLNHLYLLTFASWLIGMWGLLLFLNSTNASLRNLFWVLFIITSLINFYYFKILHAPFSINNIDKMGEVIDRFTEIDTVDLLKFLIITAAFIFFAKYIKPLGISYNKIFVIILVATVIVDITAYSWNNIPLPSIYVVIGVTLYKYMMVGLGALQQSGKR
jgi:hypothetical protein